MNAFTHRLSAAPRKALFAATLTAIAGAVLLQACGTPGVLKGSDMKAGCAGLSGASIASSALGLPSGAATISSATLVAASALSTVERGPTPAATITPAAPEYCKVLGRISPIDPKAPDINFQVNLPVAWNGRSVQYGGGGFNGVLPRANTGAWGCRRAACAATVPWWRCAG